MAILSDFNYVFSNIDAIPEIMLNLVDYVDAQKELKKINPYLHPINAYTINQTMVNAKAEIIELIKEGL